jgi:hypothetical protein
MIRKYLTEIILGIYLILVVVLIVYWEYKFIPEIFTILIYSLTIAFFLSTLLEKTNNKKIVIRTKKFNWITMLLAISFGLIKIFDKNHSFSNLIFGLITESVSQGIGYILLGLASFQRNVIINDDGIKINLWFTSRIKYCDLKDIKLTNNHLTISDKLHSYSFWIFKLSDNEVDIINKKIKEKCTLPNTAS